MYIEFELRAPIHLFIGALHQRRGLLVERTLGEKQFLKDRYRGLLKRHSTIVKLCGKLANLDIEPRPLRSSN